MRPNHSRNLAAALAFAPLLALPTIAGAQVVSNPSTAPDCVNNTAFFNPTLPPSINLPPGFTASVFAAGLNAPTSIAFRGNASNFQVFVLESGHGLLSICNDETAWPGGEFATNNPFTPDILVFNQAGGENARRTLQDANAVESLASLGNWDGSLLRFAIEPPAPEEGIAVLVQAAGGRMLGVAALQ
jgi:hypothetical protein